MVGSKAGWFEIWDSVTLVTVTRRWDVFGLLVFKVIFGVIQCTCFKIGMMEHLCNVSIAIPTCTTAVKQNVKVKGPLVALFFEIYILSLCYEAIKIQVQWNLGTRDTQGTVKNCAEY